MLNNESVEQRPVLHNEGVEQRPVLNNEGVKQRPVLSDEGVEKRPVLRGKTPQNLQNFDFPELTESDRKFIGEYARENSFSKSFLVFQI